jgi:hypothetical protein
LLWDFRLLEKNAELSRLAGYDEDLEIKLRPGTIADAEACGRICYDAFTALSQAHGFAPFRWCLTNGLRVTQPMTLMSKGLCNEPAGAFLPSILY